MRIQNIRHFTLVEILTVIAIISILAGILYPALSSVMEKARATTTRDTMSSVVQAVDSFYATYEYMPSVGSSKNDKAIDDSAITKYGDPATKGTGIEPNDNYYSFFDILAYTDHSKATGSIKPSSEAKAQNKQAIKFISTPKKYYTKASGSDKYSDSIRDAWDNPFVIFLDVEGSGIIEVNGSNYANGAYNTHVFLFSVGVPTGKKKVDNQVIAKYIKSMD